MSPRVFASRPLLVASLALAAGLVSCADSASRDHEGQLSQALFANDQTIYDYFVAKGLTSYQAAGIVGNLDQESGGNPMAVQSGGPGRGVAQWSVGGRWDHDSGDNENAFVAGEGKSMWDLGAQLDFVWFELTNFPGYGLASLQAATNVTDATIAFQDKFEGCGTCDQTNRVSYAMAVLAAYGTTPSYAAKFVSQTYPYASDGPVMLTVGQTVTGNIVMQNVGSKPWVAGVTKLASIPRDQASPFQSPSWLTNARVSTIAQDVQPGQNGTFEWDLTGSAPGDFSPFFGFVEEGVTWFADAPDGGGPPDDDVQVHIIVMPAAGTGAGGTGAAGMTAGTGGASDGGSGGSGEAGATATGGSGTAGKGAAGETGTGAGGAKSTGGSGGSGAGPNGGMAGSKTSAGGAGGAKAGAGNQSAAGGNANQAVGGASSAGGEGGSSANDGEVVVDDGPSGSSGGCGVANGSSGRAWWALGLTGLSIAARARKRRARTLSSCYPHPHRRAKRSVRPHASIARRLAHRSHVRQRGLVIKSLVAALFDATWNAAHRGQIWTSIVVVLFLSGFGFPFPEDIPLTLSGFTTFKQAGDHFVWWRYVLTFGLVVLPVLGGDLVAYSMGRRWGWALRRFRFFARLISDKGMARVQHWFHEYGSFAVFLGRQMAGLRFLTFYTAGTMKMNVAKFLLWDFVGCLVSIPVWLTLGSLAARYGQAWMEAARSTIGKWFLVAFVAGVVVLVVVMRLRRAEKEEKVEGLEEPSARHGHRI